jgi:D-tyrosyl-tRNA(Tyr) deacylase
MKIVLQRVLEASVAIDGIITGEIEKGYVLLLGVAPEDTEQTADRMADKIKRLRIFPDEQGKINVSIGDIKGELLIISQFTLYADCRKGNRPGFTGAASPAHAEYLYDYFVKTCKPVFKKVAQGAFGADMKVTLTNDGPFTVILEM